MTIIWSLIGGIRGFIYLAIIIAVASWAAVQYRKLSTAETARDQAIVQRDQAAIARDKAIGVAQANQTTIERLQAEKETLNTALNNLETAKTTNRQTAAVRETAIKQTATVPANAAPVAPVIGNLINEIQADRLRRRGATQ